MNRLAIILVRAMMAFSALLVASGIVMVFRAAQGQISDWDLSIQTDFIEYYPAQGSVLWHTLVFAVPTVAFIMAFFMLGWLERQIKQEQSF